MLDLGGLSRALSRKAGPGLQTECSERFPNGISFGELVSTNGYGLYCQKVYHVSVCAWDSEVADAQSVCIIIIIIIIIIITIIPHLYILLFVLLKRALHLK